jgi:GT2 family glycosyltransferase
VGCTLGEKMYVNHGLFVREALKAVDYIDEETCFFYNGDGDLCLKMWQAGFEIIDAPQSFIEHYPHANVDVRSTNYDRYKSDVKNYLAKWEGIYYDPIKNNLGKKVELAFNDTTKTGERFLSLHEQVIAARPDLVRQKSQLQQSMETLRWKYKAAVRKAKGLFR